MLSIRRLGPIVLCGALVCLALLPRASSPTVSAGATTTQPITSPTPLTPPPARQEIIKPEPSAEHVWIPGAWERQPGTWVWVEGHWDKPPLLPSRWVQGYWKYQEGQYQWHPGHWAASEQGIVAAKPMATPSIPSETIPPPPGANATWVPGHWEWNGTWVWVPGYYTIKPAAEATWVSGHWKQGLFGNWRWIAGHWEST